MKQCLNAEDNTNRKVGPFGSFRLFVEGRNRKEQFLTQYAKRNLTDSCSRAFIMTTFLFFFYLIIFFYFYFLWNRRTLTDGSHPFTRLHYFHFLFRASSLLEYFFRSCNWDDNNSVWEGSKDNFYVYRMSCPLYIEEFIESFFFSIILPIFFSFKIPNERRPCCLFFIQKKNKNTLPHFSQQKKWKIWKKIQCRSLQLFFFLIAVTSRLRTFNCLFSYLIHLLARHWQIAS